MGGLPQRVTQKEVPKNRQQGDALVGTGKGPSEVTPSGAPKSPVVEASAGGFPSSLLRKGAGGGGFPGACPRALSEEGALGKEPVERLLCDVLRGGEHREVSRRGILGGFLRGGADLVSLWNAGVGGGP